MNKERPASAEEAASALSRALLSVGQGTSPPPAVVKSASAEGEAKQADEYEDGLEPDSLDEDEDSDDA